MSMLIEENFNKRNNYLDIVFCIDCSGSMEDFIRKFQKESKTLYKNILEQSENRCLDLKVCRIKIITFKDLHYKDDSPVMDSGFFELPNDHILMEDYVSSINPLNGSCNYNYGLQALSLAIKSDWQKHVIDANVKNTYRHLIVMITDSESYPLDNQNDTKVKDDIKTGCAKSLEELCHWWENDTNAFMPRGKKLCLFAPDVYPWAEIGLNFNVCMHHPLHDTKDFDFSLIYHCIY